MDSEKIKRYVQIGQAIIYVDFSTPILYTIPNREKYF